MSKKRHHSQVANMHGRDNSSSELSASPGAMKTGVVMMGRLPRVMGGASGRGNPAGAGSGAGMGANRLSVATPTNPAVWIYMM